MEFDYLFLWIVALSAGSLLYRFYRQGLRYYRSWAIAAALVLIIEICAVLLFSHGAGYVAFTAWMLILMIPIILSRKLSDRLMAQNFEACLPYARVLKLLHPVHEYRVLPDLLKKLGGERREDQQASVEILHELAMSGGVLGFIALSRSLALQGKWQELRDWVEQQLSLARLSEYPAIIPFYLRALGELGDYATLLRLAHLCQANNVFRQTPQLLPEFYLMVFAFCGKREPVQALLDDQLSSYSTELKSYWTATADQTSDFGLEADSIFFDLKQSSDPGIRASAAHRLRSKPPVALRVIGEDGMKILDALELAFERSNLQEMGPVAPRSLALSLAIVAITSATFLLQLYWEHRFPEKSLGLILFELGALLPIAVYQEDQWWRLITPLFLHVSFAHLFVNMLGVFVLGPTVEQRYSPLKMLVLYFLSGVGSLYFVVHLNLIGVLKQSLLIGASGAVMGFIGAIAAPLIIDAIRSRSFSGSDELRSIGFILLVQFLFDTSLPQVSSAAHIGGFLSGLLLGMLLTLSGEGLEGKKM